VTRILVLTGGLIHLVHQLAVVREEIGGGRGNATIAVLITGILRRDPRALEPMQAACERWFAGLRRIDPEGFGGLAIAAEESHLPEGEWDLACVNSQWLEGQRRLVERLGIRRVVVAGDGLGIYYRCARELRAVVPSLLGLPIPEPGRSITYVLSGRQPRWHRPPHPPSPPPRARRRQLFEALVTTQAAPAAAAAAFCRHVTDADRPLWLCSVPNLAHQFPGGRMPLEVLQRWMGPLEHVGFSSRQDRLVLIDHPKAPPQGSFGEGARTLPWLAGPLRTEVPLEVLVKTLERDQPDRPVLVAGLTSSLYGVRELTGVRVVWLGLAPLWRSNPHYRRRPLEFLHRLLRVRRMALLTAQLGDSPPSAWAEDQ
jgi:hypothetical protein